MNAKELRAAVDMLTALLAKLSDATERHSSECCCRFCTAGIGGMLAHNHLSAALEELTDGQKV